MQTEPLCSKMSSLIRTPKPNIPAEGSKEPQSFGDGSDDLTFLTSLTRWYSVLDGPCLCGEKQREVKVMVTAVKTLTAPQ